HPARALWSRIDEQMRAPSTERNQACDLRVAGYRRELPVGAPLEIVAKELRDVARRQRGRHFAVTSPGQKKCARDDTERRYDDQSRPDRTQHALAAQMHAVAGHND